MDHRLTSFLPAPDSNIPSQTLFNCVITRRISPNLAGLESAVHETHRRLVVISRWAYRGGPASWNWCLSSRAS